MLTFCGNCYSLTVTIWSSIAWKNMMTTWLMNNKFFCVQSFILMTKNNLMTRDIERQLNFSECREIEVKQLKFEKLLNWSSHLPVLTNLNETLLWVLSASLRLGCTKSLRAPPPLDDAAIVRAGLGLNPRQKARLGLRASVKKRNEKHKKKVKNLIKNSF
jgi:hypothetical protein